MIEPIGLVGTLIGIIQICNKVVSVCYEYRNAVRGAAREISLVLDEITSVGEIAKQLFKIVDTNAPSEFPLLQAMTTGGGTLDTCLAELTDLKQTLKLGKKSARKTALMWPWKQTETEKRLQIIRRIKATMQLGLSADNAQNMVEILTHTRSLPLIQKDVSGIASYIEMSCDDQEREKCLAWLGGRHQATKHQEELQKCAKGTGNWLLQNESYVEWKSNPGRLLWLNGTAGCGKSVLCAKVIQDLQSDVDGDDEASLGFFYIDGSSQRPLDMECLYKSFIAQIISQEENLPPNIKYLYWQYRDHRKFRSIPLEQFWHSLQKVLTRRDKTYIVLDALDECEAFPQLGLDRIIQFIEKLASIRRVRLIAFSRNLEQLRAIFDNLNATSIGIDSEAQSIDLQTVLQHQLYNEGKFVRWPSLLKKSVSTRLLAQANGSFRWLDCQLQSLNHCATPVAVQKALADLPKTLEIFYSRVLGNVDEGNRESVKNLLRWVAFAFRSLSVDELMRAVAINASDASAAPFFDENLELLDPDGFLDSLSSLVTTYRNSDDSSGGQKVYVKLAHFTVKEYLGSDAIRDGLFSDFFMEARLVHTCLARSCLAYFHYAINSRADAPENLNDIIAQDPLVAYTGHFWVEHMRLTDGDEDFTPSVQSTLLDIFDVGKPFYRVWIKVANIDRPWYGEGSNDTADYTPLYCAAYIGLFQVVATLLQRGADPDTTCGIYGNALQAASLHGHARVVGELLHAKINVNAERGALGSALGAAASRGHTDIAKKLIEAGASVGEVRKWRLHGQRLDPLYQAVVGGHLNVCELLLEHGAEDYFHMKGAHPSALQASVTTGRVDIVRLLLKYSQIRVANDSKFFGVTRCYTGGYAASQYAAAAHGQVDILRELLNYDITTDEAFRYAARAGDEALVLEHLDNGVDIDSRGSIDDYPCALQSAALGGHLSLVQKLLDRGADPKLESSRSSAVDAAVRGGNIEVVKVLLEAGADANGSCSPLYTALEHQRKDIAKLLLLHGADTDWSLRVYILRGDFGSFKTLLDLGAVPYSHNAQDKLSVLATAAWGGSVPIVRYLIDNGFEHQLNPKLAETTPLMAAIGAESWSVVPLLLDYGADVNAPLPEKHERPNNGQTTYDGQYWPMLTSPDGTSLTLAIKAKSPDIAHTLIRHGALVTPPTSEEAGTPLLYAVWEGFTELGRELLEAGADPKQRGTILNRGRPTFPLLIAAEKGNLEMVTYLMGAGATVDDQDEEGFSALHAAAAGRSGTETLDALIREYKADLKVELLNGSRPIHCAAEKGTANHVKVLLDAGASPHDMNKTGRTPLHWAAESGNWDTVEFLLDQGADVNVKADQGGPATPLDLAYLAKNTPPWLRIVSSDEWDDERVDMLLQRMVQVT